MDFWRSAGGSVRIKLTSADTAGALKLLTDRGVMLYDVKYEKELCVCFTIDRNRYFTVHRLLTDRGDQCAVVDKNGLYWIISRIRDRAVLVSGVAILIALSIFIPSRILFVLVEGNEQISDRQILQQLELCGLRFGSSRAAVRSEKLKNNLLECNDRLDWVGITTAGCVATVQVREKPAYKEDRQEEIGTNIVAVCDGVIDSVTVTKGTGQCVPGQAVYRGQVLISGYEDHGFVIRATGAEGEIYANTYRQIQGVCLRKFISRREIKRTTVKFSLQIGKNRINFFQDSGISPPGCVKMYLEKQLTLPGGFLLPVSLIEERCVFYDMETENHEENSFFWAESYFDSRLRSQMNAGQILQRNTSTEMLEELYVLYGEYACFEQIGQKSIEEFVDHNGENGG